MSDPSQVEIMKEQLSPRLFQCPGEPQPIERAVHLARLERCYPKCRQCEFCEQLGEVSERRIRGIRTILSEAEPTLTDRFAIKGIESELSDTTRFERWAARFGLYLRQSSPKRFAEGRFPHELLADATSRTVPDFVAAVSAGLRWAGCDVTDLGRGAVGILHFAQKRLEADAGLLLAQPGVWWHECGVSVEGVSVLHGEEASDPSSQKAADEEVFQFLASDLIEGQDSGVSLLAADRPTRQLGRLERTSMTELYLKSFADRYHALRPLRITLYTSCVPVADVLRRLTTPFDVQLEVLPFSVALREGDAVDLLGAHFSVYIDGTGRVVELLDEQAVPIANVGNLSPDAVEVITTVQILLSRSETPLSELTFHGSNRDKKLRF